MAKTRITQTMTADRETPFLTMVASSESCNWEGIFAFHARLGVVDFDLAPTGEWAVENFVLQTSQNQVTLATISSERTQTGISAPGTLVVYPRKEAVKVMWSDAVGNLAFGVTDSLLKQVAAETRRGDPEHVQLQGFGIFEDPLMTQIGWTLLQLLHSEDSASRLYAESLGVSLAHHLLYKYASDQAHQTITAPSTMFDQQLQDALEYIHANYARDLLLSEIAASAHLSVAHFSRLFRKATGYSPHQYLIRCRVEQAYLFLKQCRYTAAEIAQMVGFYDESHLLRHFKRIYGTTPTKIHL